MDALSDLDPEVSAQAVSDAVWLLAQIADRLPKGVAVNYTSEDLDPASPDTGNRDADHDDGPTIIESSGESRVVGRSDDEAGELAPNPAPRHEDAPPGGTTSAQAEDLADGDPMAQLLTPRRWLDPPGHEVVRSPGVDALPDPLVTARALRPLHRRVTGRTATEIDEDATARRAADEGLWLPVHRKARDRWLELAIVVDTSSSMEIWARRVAELQNLLQWLGAFRRVRSFRFDADQADDPLVLVTGPGGVRHHPAELLDRTGRTAVLVVSDCVGQAWAGPGLGAALREWAKAGPTAIAQTLPQRLWPLCEPALAPVLLQGPHPGATNAELRVEDAGVDRPAPAGALPVPVLQIDARWIGPWARLVATPPPRPTRFVALFVDDTGIVHDGNLSAQDLTPGAAPSEPLAAFRAIASTEALRLAERLSAAPLTLPVMDLVQRTTPGVGPAALAEVFLSGLLRPAAPAPAAVAEDVEFDFVDGVRERLLAGLPRPEQLDVLDRVSALVAHRLGLPRNDFRAFVSGSDDATEVLAGSGAFARVALRVFAALGGRYGEVARRIAGHPRMRPQLHNAALPEGAMPGLDPSKAPTSITGSVIETPSDGVSDNENVYDHVPVGDSSVTAAAAPSAVARATGSPLYSSPPPAFPPAGGPRVFGGVPFRNSYFTGRVELLERLHTMLRSGASQMALLPHALHGMGGVGKTQLAIEYTWRYAHEYDLVWWLRAESTTTVRAGLLELAAAMGLPETDASKTVLNVIEVLQQRVEYPRWLIVFDNANAPDELHGYLPAFGHVLVTSRDAEWADVAEQLEVDVFARDESIALLQRRGSGISARDADGLAQQLGDLPLALDQAAAWQAATGTPVLELQRLLRDRMTTLMAEPGPAAYPASLMATWDLAFTELRRRSPGAARLLELLAFFGPDPISIPMLQDTKGADLPDPLGRVLRDEILLRRAIREIGRYALAKPNASKDDIEIHRLVQLVLREQLPPQEQEATRDAVHRVIGAANPGFPDFPRTWPRHAELLPHITPARVVHGKSEAGHRAALDQIRYRYQRGDYERAAELAEGAITAWRSSRGDDDELTLIAQRHLAATYWELGRYHDAAELNEHTLGRMKAVFGDNHEHTLATMNAPNRDRRIRGRWAEALTLSEEALERHRGLYGDDDPETLKALNNVAVSQRFLGNANAALENDERCYRARVDILGSDSPSTQISLINVGRDLTDAGRYSEALTLLREALPRIERNGALHRNTISAKRTLAIALRRSGATARARELAEEVFRAADRVLSAGNERRLAITVTYANTLLAVGETAAARGLAERAYEGYSAEFGAEHPSTLAAALDLAVVYRRSGERTRALDLDRASHESLLAGLGEDHPYVLVAKTNIAHDLALGNEFHQALELSREAYERSLRIRGENRPETLICGLNHALDLRATGDEEAAQNLYERIQVTLRRDYGEQHAASRAAAAGVRADADIEPWET